MPIAIRAHNTTIEIQVQVLILCCVQDLAHLEEQFFRHSSMEQIFKYFIPSPFAVCYHKIISKIS